MLFPKKRRLEQSKIIVIGAGEVGFNIAQRLSGEKKSVVVIDLDAEALRRLEDGLDVQTVLGSGASPGILIEAGTKDASIVLAVTDSDSANLLACTFANVIAPQAIKLARIRDEDYTSHADILASAALNISLLVNPDEEIVRMIDRLLSLPGALEYGDFAKGKLRVVGMHVYEGPLVGQPLKRFRDIVQDPGIMVAAIVRDQRMRVPSGDDRIEEDDLVYFVYLSSSQNKLLSSLHRTRTVFNSVCIVGGGNIGFKLAQRLEGKGIRVKLLEHNAERCEEIAEQLSSTLVLHGDGTDKQMLMEENVHAMDVVVAVTSDDETNILTCLLAKSLGVKETVVRVNKSAYLPLLHNIGIDHSVSPRLAAVNCILQYIRQGGILSSFSVGGEAAEIVEVQVDADSPFAGKNVRELGLPKGALLLGLVRNEEASIPTGSTSIQAQDRVIILIERKVVSDVEMLLTAKKA